MKDKYGSLTRNIHSIITYPKIKSIKIMYKSQEKIGKLYGTYLDL